MSAIDSPESVYGVWRGSLGHLMSYRYLGCRSTLLTRTTARGTMPLRRDMRSSGGPLGAPLAIAMLDTAGIAIDRLYHAAVTHVVVQILDDARGVERVRIDGETVREGRSQLLAQATIVDDANPGRVIAVGTSDWVVLGPTASGFEYTDPGHGVADTPGLPPLTEPYHAVAANDGSYRIDKLVPAIGGVMLHHGPIAVTLEAAALEAVNRLGATGAMVRSLELRFLRPGLGGPFTVEPVTVVAPEAAVRACRAVMVDEGRDARVIAHATVLVTDTGGST